MASNASEPLCLVVSVEISPECIDAFLAVMKIDAEESRNEEGCLRFDVLRDESNPNKFIFYEVVIVHATASSSCIHNLARPSMHLTNSCVNLSIFPLF